jgi:tagatose 6-phosphate kinase
VKEVGDVATRQPVLTVTLNAALDVTYNARRFGWGDQNRVEAVHRRAGGKGVNVARVLEQLGVGALVTGFAGGPTGEAIRRSLQAGGFQERLLEITSESRTTVVTVSEADGLVTTFDEPGPTVSSTEWERFLVLFDELVRGRRAVALSGSLAQGLPEDAYRRLAEVAARHGVPAILDSSGKAFMAGLGGRPAVVKPNLKELLEASGAEATRGDVLAAARELQRRGAEAVVVSMGKEGLRAVTPEGDWQVVPPEVRGNPIGAGDTAVAALIAGLIEGQPWPQRLARAAALSAAAVAYPVAGGYDPARYPELLEKTSVRRLDDWRTSR